MDTETPMVTTPRKTTKATFFGELDAKGFSAAGSVLTNQGISVIVEKKLMIRVPGRFGTAFPRMALSVE